jgi:CRP-like cAMP-binding protein
VTVTVGIAFTLASAVALSALGVTTQLAFDAGAPVGVLLPGRFQRRGLARLAATIEVPAGLQVLRQGASPDAFFVIRRGRARVERDARHVADLGPGDFFGELALLAGGERTASVVASTDMRIHVVSRGEFLRAMQRLPTLARRVREVASTRMRVAPAAA